MNALLIALMLFPAMAMEVKDHNKDHDNVQWQSEIDMDRDGRISKEEYLTACKARFAIFDVNGDGKLDEAEITAARSKAKEKIQELGEQLREKFLSTDKNAR